MKRMFKSLITFVKINPVLYLTLFVFSVLSEFVPLITGIIIGNLFNALQMNQRQEFFILAISFSLILLGHRFMQYQYGMIDAKITFETDRYYIFNTLNKIMVYGKKLSVGAVMNILNIDLKQINYQGMSIIDLLSKTFFLVSAIIVMFLTHQLITVAIIIPFMIGNFLLLIGEKRYLNYYASQRDASLDYFDFLHDLIKNTKHHRYIENKNYLYKQLEKLNRPAQKTALRKEIYLQALRSGIVLLNHLVILILIVLGWQEGLSLGVMIMFITYVSTAFNFSLLFNVVLNNQSQLKFFEDKFVAIENEIANISNDFSDKPLDIDLVHKISSKITQLKSGNILQITTLENEYLYALIKQLKKDIGYVANEFQLFDESVDKNLTLFNSQTISESTIKEALTISNFPLSKRDLSTIGSNGMKLSAGERQRLAIARALVAGDLIIMDMSFENIDLKTKVEIINRLKTTKKRYVMISSDTQLEKYSDYVVTEFL